jgi:hypothetical protein
MLAIPPATPEKYRGMVDMKGWRNPYLILRADGVALLDPENHLERILKAGELAQAFQVRCRGHEERQSRSKTKIKNQNL